MPHVPDTGPGKRVTGAGARTEGRKASRQISEVGAVCGKAARTVLCGGRSVMGVPTAIAKIYRKTPSISASGKADPTRLSIATRVSCPTIDANLSRGVDAAPRSDRNQATTPPARLVQSPPRD